MEEGAWEIHPCSYLTDLCRKSHTHCSKPVMTVLLPNLMFMLALLGGLGWLHLTSLMIYHLAICSSSLDPWIPYHRSLGECNPASVELKPCKWRWALWRNPTRKLPSTSQRGVSMSPHRLESSWSTRRWWLRMGSVLVCLCSACPGIYLSYFWLSPSVSSSCVSGYWVILCCVVFCYYAIASFQTECIRHICINQYYTDGFLLSIVVVDLI